jgi:hypothetical protein
MPISRAVPFAGLVLAALLGAAKPVAAQGSPYLPLDDPSLPLLEHLIERGDVEDPSPMVRPFRRADAVRVLTRAYTTSGSARAALIGELIRRYGRESGERTWAAEVRAGGQAYTTPRRDLLHPVGDGGVSPYADLSLRAVFGNIVAVTRPAVEPRVTDDPDWPGRPDVDIAGRLVEGYLAAQFRYGRIAYGQLDHNWGPVGMPGIPLSGYGYERQGLMLEVGNRTLRLTALATDLHDGADSAGVTNHRYYFVHRLAARFSSRLELAAWEGNVLAGAERNFDTRYRNPLSFGYLANTIGIGDRGNEMLGLDARWRAFGRTTLEAQLALDDFWYQDRDQNRDRWALTLAASGPLGAAASWRAMYSQVSSLALRAFDRAENFTDAGVGIGRNFSDNDHLLVRVSLPVRNRWLVTPELALFRQGEGRIEDPYPAPAERADFPALFVGTVERTWRAAMAVRGQEGPFALSGEAGFHHVVNAGHQPGIDDDRIEARVQATLGFGWWGSIAGDD